MKPNDRQSAWRKLDAGIRPSLWIKIGALLLGAGFVTDFVLRREITSTGSDSGLLNVPLLIFAIGLVVLGTGFFATIGRPFLGSTGWFPGMACVIHAVCAFAVIIPFEEMVRIALFAAMLKYSAFSVFAMQERFWLGIRSSIALVIVSGAEFVKILARVFELLTKPVSQVLDPALLGLQVAVLWYIAVRIALQEDLWAIGRLESRALGWRAFERPGGDS